MGASSRAPEELSREELEQEVSRLRKLESRVDRLESLIGTLGDTPADDAALTDVTLAGSAAGVLIDRNRQRTEELQTVAHDDDDRAQLGGARDEMLPIHRMYGDLRTGADRSLSATQKRAARLYGEFVDRVVSNEATRVDASGQMYSLSSGAAKEILLGKFDAEDENLLSGVKEASRSQVVSRAMRDAARLSKFENCECEDIDGCSHATVRFRSGRPNALAAPKETFRDAMEEVYNDVTEGNQ
ncbi:hypothetical protein [Salarchaeum japonicum]|uniref:hypothetical protein n=1 Tax=Salarchaeum japonicum TaxID=555573 RepID=UPI003C7800F3